MTRVPTGVLGSMSGAASVAVGVARGTSSIAMSTSRVAAQYRSGRCAKAIDPDSGAAGRVERAQGAARAGDRVSQPAAESGGDLLLLPGRGEQPAQRAELLAGALQHLVLALPVRARGPLDLGPGLAEHPREALPHARGDVSRGGSRERGVERVEATDDAWEPDERCVEIAPHRVADAVIGAEVPVIAGGRHARHAGAARARLDPVAHVLVVAARDAGAGEQRVHTSLDRVAGVLGARIAVVAGERSDGRAEPGQAGEPAAPAEGVAVRVVGARDAGRRGARPAEDADLAPRVAGRPRRAVGGPVVALLAQLHDPVPAAGGVDPRQGPHLAARLGPEKAAAAVAPAVQIDERAQAEEPTGRGEDGAAKRIGTHPLRADMLRLDDVRVRRDVDATPLAVGSTAGGIDPLVQLDVAGCRYAHVAAEAAEVG